MKKYCFFGAVLINILIIQSAFAQHQQSKTDWSHPELLDPLNWEIGDFLDIDFNQWVWKAREAYRQKEYRQAAKYYLYLLKHNFSHAETIYSLACCYGLLGEGRLAARYLIRAVNAGYLDIEHIRKDPDFKKVRKNPSFMATMKNIEDYIKNFGDVVYVEAVKMIPCRIQLPENYNPEKSYPLLVGLHGNGGTPEEFITTWNTINNPDFIYASPQGAYYRTQDVGSKIRRYKWGFPTENKNMWVKADLITEKYVLNVVKELSGMYNISDVYLLGFSEGAGFTYIIGLRNPDIFKGIICFAGYLSDPDDENIILNKEHLEKSKNMKVFIAHGKQDSAIGFKSGQKAKNFLEKYGYKVKFYEFNGGHTVDPGALNEAVKWIGIQK